MTADAPRDESQAASTPPETATFYARVSGSVQGVGFRFFVLRLARDLKLAGSVRNRPDGDVELWAHGPRSQLQAFEALLHEGPPLSRVERVAVHWGAKVQHTDDFIIDF